MTNTYVILLCQTIIGVHLLNCIDIDTILNVYLLLYWHFFSSWSTINERCGYKHKLYHKTHNNTKNIEVWNVTHESFDSKITIVYKQLFSWCSQSPNIWYTMWTFISTNLCLQLVYTWFPYPFLNSNRVIIDALGFTT